jgi:Ni/Fe-hydrogenase 1 B-type cytochrome subunit
LAELKRVRIWSGLVRAAHWAMAAGTLAASATGGLMVWGRESAPPVWIAARELHVPSGQLVAVALAVRLVVLVVGGGSAGWRDFLPRRAQWTAAWGTMRFYLSGTRYSLPSWYAHNPLWGPVYLALFGLLAAQTGLGLWLEVPSLRPILVLEYGAALEWHHALADGVLGIALAHILAAVIHDWRGGRWEISAMINGDKVFEIQRPEVGMRLGGTPIRPASRESVGHWEPRDAERN